MEQDVVMAMKVNSEVTKLFDEGLLKTGPDGKQQVVRDPVEEQRIKTEVQSASKVKEPSQTASQQQPLDELSDDEGNF